MRHKYLKYVLKQTRSDSTFILPKTETDTWLPTPQDIRKVTKVFANLFSDLIKFGTENNKNNPAF